MVSRADGGDEDGCSIADYLIISYASTERIDSLSGREKDWMQAEAGFVVVETKLLYSSIWLLQASFLASIIIG
jgi:hypothetical protein